MFLKLHFVIMNWFFIAALFTTAPNIGIVRKAMTYTCNIMQPLKMFMKSL